jgi:TonB family protein
MKNMFSTVMLAAGLITTQSCMPKKNNETVTDAYVDKKEVTLTAAERKAKFEKQKWERVERRRIANEKRVMREPTYTDKKGKLVYNKAEIEPAYIGGKEAMRSYLRDNLKYPQEEFDKKDEAVVFVDFVVDKDGIVREVEVTEDTNENVDANFRSEAARVVSSMPKWTPGRQHGKAVDVKFSVPISFVL